jgi:hypothetical protein
MADLLIELRGNSCRCGRWKQQGNTLCGYCFFSLPFRLRRDLYLPAGSGYEKAFERAQKILISSGKWPNPVK